MKYRKHIQKQIFEFIGMIAKIIRVKEESLMADIVLSSAVALEGNKLKKEPSLKRREGMSSEEETYSTFDYSCWQFGHYNDYTPVSKYAAYRHAKSNCTLFIKNWSWDGFWKKKKRYFLGRCRPQSIWNTLAVNQKREYQPSLRFLQLKVHLLSF